MKKRKNWGGQKASKHQRWEKEKKHADMTFVSFPTHSNGDCQTEPRKVEMFPSNDFLCFFLGEKKKKGKGQEPFRPVVATCMGE